MSTVVEIKTSMYLCLFYLGSVLGVKQGLLQDAVFIQYDLFGNPVSTDEFRDSARFTQEMATAKIFSNIDNILEFFGWHIEPISFTFHNSVNNRSGHSIYYFFTNSSSLVSVVLTVSWGLSAYCETPDGAFVSL